MENNRQVLDRWMEQFWKLTNDDVNEDEKKKKVATQTIDDSDQMVEYPTLNEKEVGVGKLKNNEAHGQDNLPQNY